VYLPSVLNTNEFFPSLVLQNHTHITIDIWALLLLSVFILLAIAVFFILVLIRFSVRQKTRLIFGLGDIFPSAILLLTVAFFLLSLSLCLPFFMSISRFLPGVTALF
jgi:hypothetical protein